VELRHLRYFLAVAEQSHFRNAAEALFVSQPTLSLQIKDLEAELGVALFERVGRRARLTQAGQLYREFVLRALKVLEEGKAALDELDGLVRGSLTVGVVQTVNSFLTPLVVAEFAKAHPNVTLKIVQLSAGEIESGVRDGTLDLGVSFTPSSSASLQMVPLLDEEFVVVVSRKHPLSKRQTVKVSELQDMALCLLGKEFCTRRIIDEAFAKAHVAPRVGIEMNSVEGIMAVVTAGGPPTILPRLAVQGDRLAIVRLERPTPKRTVCILQLDGQRSGRARSEFVRLLRQLAPKA
jgi:LysR family transcriptional regulator, cyn operon transcriptional activator